MEQRPVCLSGIVQVAMCVPHAAARPIGPKSVKTLRLTPPTRQCTMGPRLAHLHDPSILGQYGSSGYSLCRHSKKPVADVPASVPAFFLCTIPYSDPSQSHSWSAKYGSGCPVKGHNECLLVLCSTGLAQPYPPPLKLLDMLLLSKCDWTSSAWRSLSRALAPSTLCTYSSGQRRYLSFCEAAGMAPLPLSEHSLYMFVAWLARDGLAHQTIKSYLLAMRHFHILAG